MPDIRTPIATALVKRNTMTAIPGKISACSADGSIAAGRRSAVKLRATSSGAVIGLAIALGSREMGAIDVSAMRKAIILATARTKSRLPSMPGASSSQTEPTTRSFRRTGTTSKALLPKALRT